MFVEYIENRQQEICDIPEIGHFALLALCAAHEKIIEGKENIWDAVRLRRGRFFDIYSVDAVGRVQRLFWAAW